MAATAHPFGAGGFGPWTASDALTVVPDTLRGALLATARNRSVRMIPYEKDMLYAPEGKIFLVSFHRSSLVAVSALAMVSLKPSVSPKARTAARLTSLSA